MVLEWTERDLVHKTTTVNLWAECLAAVPYTATDVVGPAASEFATPYAHPLH